MNRPINKGRKDGVGEEALPKEILYLSVTTERIELAGRRILQEIGYSAMAPTARDVLFELLGLEP